MTDTNKTPTYTKLQMVETLKKLSQSRETKRKESLEASIQSYIKERDYSWIVNNKEKLDYVEAIDKTTWALETVIRCKLKISTKLKDFKTQQPSKEYGYLYIQLEHQEAFAKFIKSCMSCSQLESIPKLSNFVTETMKEVEISPNYKKMENTLQYQKQTILETRAALDSAHKNLEKIKYLSQEISKYSTVNIDDDEFNCEKENESGNQQTEIEHEKIPWIVRFPKE